jgi:hypothetical protein
MLRLAKATSYMCKLILYYNVRIEIINGYNVFHCRVMSHTQARIQKNQNT